MMENTNELNLDVRHFIYQTFSNTSKPPTTIEIGNHLQVSISEIENSLERLADSHHIALAPGSYSIWMAHPYSGIPTKFVAEINGKKYWGN
jgi:hypothetical protein